MVWTDTHVHFDSFEKTGETAAVLARALTAGVLRCVAIGGSPEANAGALRIAADFPDRIRAAIGFDRHRVHCPSSLESLDSQLALSETVAVGECGLDYAGGQEDAQAQRDLFEDMLTCAVKHHLPMVVHTRRADADTLAMLRNYAVARAAADGPEPGASPPGLVHCFTGGIAFAEALVDMGWFISLSGIVTFHNAKALRETVRRIPIDRLLLETDTPYLAPAPLRGKPNEPSYLPHTGREVAALLNLHEEELARITSENAARIFAWPAVD